MIEDWLGYFQKKGLVAHRIVEGCGWTYHDQRRGWKDHFTPVEGIARNRSYAVRLHLNTTRMDQADRNELRKSLRKLGDRLFFDELRRPADRKTHLLIDQSPDPVGYRVSLFYPSDSGAMKVFQVTDPVRYRGILAGRMAELKERHKLELVRQESKIVPGRGAGEGLFHLVELLLLNPQPHLTALIRDYLRDENEGRPDEQKVRMVTRRSSAGTHLIFHFPDEFDARPLTDLFENKHTG